MLITLLVVLLVVALIYWVITTLPLPQIVKTFAIVILVVIVCIYLLNLVGIGTGLL